MSITPPSDIILDVVNAADGAKKVFARQRLEKLTSLRKLTSTQPVENLQKSAPGQVTLTTFHAEQTMVKKANDELLATTGKKIAGSQDNRHQQVFRKLEGVLLQGIVSSMLSAQKASLYGKGLPATYWKSFMAEAIAGKIADGGGVGIADVFAARTANAAGSSKAQTLTGPLHEKHAKLAVSPEYQLFLQKLFLEKLAGQTDHTKVTSTDNKLGNSENA